VAAATVVSAAPTAAVAVVKVAAAAVAVAVIDRPSFAG